MGAAGEWWSGSSSGGANSGSAAGGCGVGDGSVLGGMTALGGVAAGWGGAAGAREDPGRYGSIAGFSKLEAGVAAVTEACGVMCAD